ncbi:MAG: response regulator [Ignavibacteria bacterium]|nr:response regulator [Ignavibacteria bacterium]
MSIDKLKILVVEDNRDNREVITLFIRGIASLDFALNGEEALAKTEQNSYDIILMDINLGMGLSGIDVTKQLRQNEKYKLTPIVAVTAYSLMDDKQQILNAGCSHYVGKPFTRKELLELISNISVDYHL